LAVISLIIGLIIHVIIDTVRVTFDGSLVTFGTSQKSAMDPLRCTKSSNIMRDTEPISRLFCIGFSFFIGDRYLKFSSDSLTSFRADI